MSIHPLADATSPTTLSGLFRDLFRGWARPADPTRFMALGMDPATGRYRHNEAETAIRIEKALGVRLTRAPHWSRADWFDQYGTSYDAVGPFASYRFDQQWRRFSEQIVLHLAKAELVPVDVTLFTVPQIEIIDRFITARRLAPRVFILGRR